MYAREMLTEVGLRDTPPLIMIEEIVENICLQAVLGLLNICIL